MTTLAALKAEIADDLARSDLTSQIAAAVTNAIRHYNGRRFYFNEQRSATFTTADGQARYSSADDADIPLVFRLDGVFLEDSSGQSTELERCDPVEIETLLDNSAASGEPLSYAYYGQTFALHPIPDAAYTVRLMGHIAKAAPATDGETGNVWMTEAYELIRCRAKAYLYLHVLRNPEMSGLMRAAEDEALGQLREDSQSRVASGTIWKTEF